MNPWSSVAILVGLAAAAGKLPATLAPLLPSGPAVDRINAAGVPVPLEVDPESRDVLANVRPRVEVLVTPIMGKILAASRERSFDVEAWKSRSWEALRGAASRWGPAAARGIIGAIAVSPALGLVFLLLGWKGLSRPLGEWGLSLCRGGVIGMSAGGAFLFVVAGVSLWKLLPPALWAAPLAGMLANALLLRCVDLNHPVWNRLTSGFLVPLAAWTFMFFWARALGRPLF